MHFPSAILSNYSSFQHSFHIAIIETHAPSHNEGTQDWVVEEGGEDEKIQFYTEHNSVLCTRIYSHFLRKYIQVEINMDCWRGVSNPLLFKIDEGTSRIATKKESQNRKVPKGSAKTGPVGIEPTTTWLKARCSTELSYGPQAVMV